MQSTAVPADTFTPRDREDAFLSFLVDRGELDPTAAARVRAALKSSAQTMDIVLLELGLMTEARLADHYCSFLGTERASAGEFPLELWPELGVAPEFLRAHGIVVLSVNDSSVTVAVSQPLQSTPVVALGRFTDRAVIVKVAERTAISQHLAKQLTAEARQGEAVTGATSAQEDDIERLRDAARDVPTIRLLNRLIAAAADRGASDIHIEPFEDRVRVRYRIDGSLQIAENLSRDVQAGLSSRTKILARLNIAEQRLPQDGRIRVPIRGREIDMRVSTVPTLYGESIALRLLDRNDLPLDFKSLGFAGADASRLTSMLARPNGILLVTGPTGSGKTTTLYAALSLLNSTESKVFTVEDPIEYRLTGINQIQVKPQIGLDFAAVLRSVLRQDPDTIMIGEMRDLETARIAIQASLTGHFVLSTLHTNSAAGTITRLRDMGVESYLLASTLRAVLSQRLVRKLCPACQSGNARQKRQAIAELPQPSAAHGCSTCHGTGYKGRTVIYELLDVSPALRECIAASASEEQINRVAISSGMVPMHLNAQSKVADGITSTAEVTKAIAGYAN